jgi:glycosyltransferase involved in cell wall biosynthesis
VAEALERRGYGDFAFLLTVEREAWLGRVRAARAIDPALVDAHFRFIGAVPPQEIGRVYAEADVLISLSDLESFSNNYMEAWKVGIPQLVSERDFSRNICRESAVYAEPHDPEDVAAKIEALGQDEALRRRLVANGKELLRELPEFDTRWERVYGIVMAAIDERSRR